MTEAEWDACTEPKPMLGFLGRRASIRKLRLLACACCRRVWHLLPNARYGEAVEASELWADGRIGRGQLPSKRRATRNVHLRDHDLTPAWFAGVAALQAAGPRKANLERALWYADVASRGLCGPIPYPVPGDDKERRHQCSLIRDVFNPCCLPPLESALLAWNDGTVRKVAQAIYDDRSFDRLPLLADALEDAGCTDAAILDHCRGPGPHVRGCWVVDLLLNKE